MVCGGFRSLREPLSGPSPRSCLLKTICNPNRGISISKREYQLSPGTDSRHRSVRSRDVSAITRLRPRPRLVRCGATRASREETGETRHEPTMEPTPLKTRPATGEGDATRAAGASQSPARRDSPPRSHVARQLVEQLAQRSRSRAPPPATHPHEHRSRHFWQRPHTNVAPRKIAGARPKLGGARSAIVPLALLKRLTAAGRGRACSPAVRAAAAGGALRRDSSSQSAVTPHRAGRARAHNLRARCRRAAEAVADSRGLTAPAAPAAPEAR